ncbi:MAG TPA: YbjN domain-containing protein [Mycobacteriales bacterium]|nr:YbjN domain-containing protein [Mycobacteriales bacterium]
MTAADPATALADVVRAALDDREVEYDEDEPGAFLCKLPGSHKLATMTWLVVGDHSLHVEAFFIRKPDENHAGFYKWLLERNAKMYAVSFAVDNIGDVYLVGRLPLAAVTAEEIDRILGSVLTYADEWFDSALELGFRTSIEKEWDWRVKRGESLRNLEAFARFADPANRR